MRRSINEFRNEQASFAGARLKFLEVGLECFFFFLNSREPGTSNMNYTCYTRVHV